MIKKLRKCLNEPITEGEIRVLEIAIYILWIVALIGVIIFAYIIVLLIIVALG